MGLNWEGGMMGAGQGFMSTGSPWGALAGGIMGLFSGDDPTEDLIKAQEVYYQTMTNIANARWQEYQQVYAPLVKELGAELAKGPQAEKAAQYASADVMQSFAKQRESTLRNMAKFGIDPRSGAGTSQMIKTDMQVAATEAGAKNIARRDAERQHRRDVMEFTKSGQGIPSQAMSAFGSAGSGMASMVDAVGDQPSGAAPIFSALTPESISDMGKWFGGGKEKPIVDTMSGPAMTGIYGHIGNRPIGGQADGGPVQGYEDGGMPIAAGPVQGPGGPIDDEIPAQVPPGSYVIPADVVEKLGVQFFDKILQQAGGVGGAEGMQGRANAMLSNGEYVIPADVVKQKGKKFFDDLLEKYHKPAAKQSPEYQEKNDGAAAPKEMHGGGMVFGMGRGRPQAAAGRGRFPMAAPSAQPSPMRRFRPMASGYGRSDGGKVEKVMGEYKRGTLHSGSKSGPVVSDRKQAIAIAMSEAGKSRKADGGPTSPEKEVKVPDNVQPESIKSKVDEIANKYKEKKQDGGVVSGNPQAGYKKYCIEQQSNGMPCKSFSEWSKGGPGEAPGKADGGKIKKTRRGGRKHKRFADGGPVKYSREWYEKHGIRPQPGQQGPAPKTVEGTYGKDQKKKPSASVVSKFGAGHRAKARREASEGYEGEKK